MTQAIDGENSFDLNFLLTRISSLDRIFFSRQEFCFDKNFLSTIFFSLTITSFEHESSTAVVSIHCELSAPKTPTVPEEHSPQVLSSRSPSLPQSARLRDRQSGAAEQFAAFRLELATSSTCEDWIHCIGHMSRRLRGRTRHRHHFNASYTVHRS